MKHIRNTFNVLKATNEELLRRIEKLEVRIEMLEKGKPSIKRRHKWHSRIFDAIRYSNTPMTKDEILKWVIYSSPSLRLELDVTKIKYRLSSSYAKMIKDKKIFAIKSKNESDKSEVYVLATWLNENNIRDNRRTKEWFLYNLDYDYPR